VGEDVTAADVIAAVDYVTSALDPGAGHPERWSGPAGTLRWSCTTTMAHVLDSLLWYAASLARCSTRGIEVIKTSEHTGPSVLLDGLRSGGAVLAVAVTAAGPGDRGWHLFGSADRSGFAAMGADELLVHGADVAAGLGLAYDPPRPVCERVARRLFPWAPPGGDPWATLRWANGRAPLGDRPPPRRWQFYCAPLDEWDGIVPEPGRRAAPGQAGSG
jgi:uncharacterized protein (TIGR03083 family)